jgi:integrase
MATGIRTRHARSCQSHDDGGRCNCTPSYQAQAYDARTGRQVWRTFPTLAAAKLWRQDAQVALRRGTMRPPTTKTIAEAAEALIAGAHDGTILDRGGKPYKPSTARGYEQLLHSYVVPALGGWKLSQVQRRDVQDFVDDLRKQGLSASTIANIPDPLRVIFRRAIRRDEITIDPTDNLDLPAIRGQRDRIEPPERADEYLAALPDSERAFWAVALFCGLRRGELRGLQWFSVDFDAGVIRVERSWDPVKGPVDVKTGAGRRAVPMAFVVRRALMAHKARTGRDGPDLVFGRTATEVFYASTIRARANKAWQAAGLEPITPHEARHCAISYFIVAGLDWKQISTWAGHGDVRQTWNRYGHLVPGGEAAAERLDVFLTPSRPVPTVAQDPNNDETPNNAGVLQYRYRDSNPGFRRERATEHPVPSRKIAKFPISRANMNSAESPNAPNVREMFGSGSDGGSPHAAGFRLRGRTASSPAAPRTRPHRPAAGQGWCTCGRKSSVPIECEPLAVRRTSTRSHNRGRASREAIRARSPGPALNRVARLRSVVLEFPSKRGVGLLTPAFEVGVVVALRKEKGHELLQREWFSTSTQGRAPG